MLVGCGSTAVQVEPVRSAADGPAAEICPTLIDEAPTWLGSAARRPVEPADASAVAWGDPAIVLRCGVEPPAALTPSSPCLDVNGVGWFAEPAEYGYYFTTIGRTVAIEVAVPDAYAPQAQRLVELADVIDAHDPAIFECR